MQTRLFDPLGMEDTTFWLNHSGAHATDMQIHTVEELVVIWIAQHGG